MINKAVIWIVLIGVVVGICSLIVVSINREPPLPPFPIPPKPTPDNGDDTVDPDIELTGKIVRVWAVNSVTITRSDIKLPIIRRQQYNLWGIKPPASIEFQNKARAYLSNLVLDREVPFAVIEGNEIALYRTEVDPRIDGLTNYEVINLKLVLDGWALAAHPDLESYEKEARDNKRGLWGN